MTRDEILAMEAGRELDVLIADMMGEVVCAKHPNVWPGEWCRKCQRHAARAYSTQIVPAWSLMERVVVMEHVAGFHYEWLPHGNEQPCASFQHRPSNWKKGNVQAWQFGESGPHAICRATIFTVMRAEDD